MIRKDYMTPFIKGTIMKVIVTKNLINLLTEKCNGAVITKEQMSWIFEEYGDDYFKDCGESAWEKCTDRGSQALKRLLGEKFVKGPEKF